MSMTAFHTALEQWVVSTYSTAFNVTVGSTNYSVKVFHDNLTPVTPADAPAVRFAVVLYDTVEGSPALTEGRGALLVQVFIEQGISADLAWKIAGTIEAAAKRSTFTTKGNFGASSLLGQPYTEPTHGLYQLTLRIPFWYLEAA